LSGALAGFTGMTERTAQRWIKEAANLGLIFGSGGKYGLISPTQANVGIPPTKSNVGAGE
jgi:hypothetical protein